VMELGRITSENFSRLFGLSISGTPADTEP
jgi:hypothetical protein